MRKLFNLLRGKRARLEHDLERELRYHVDRRVFELIAAGVDEVEARRQARVEFGGATQVQEDVRETWIWRSVDALVRDVRFAVRGLTRHWGFTLGAGAVLALGIAANAAIFSVVNTVLLRPLDYLHADRIVSVETQWTNTGRVASEVAGPDFLEWQASGVFEVLGHSDGEDDVATVVEGRAQFANHRTVSGGFFDVFGLPASAGRPLTREDDVPGARPIAVVSHQLAETNFGSAQAAVGKSLIFFGLPVQIVGVAAPRFRYPASTDIWMPNGGTNRTNRANHPYQAVGKLASGVSVANAQSRIRAIGDRLAQQYPENRFKNFVVTPLQKRLTGDVQATLWMLMGAVMLVLMIGCANIANLLLAMSAARSREIALRTALGAGRGRVVRQLLTENFVLAGLAAVAGVVLARGLLQALVALSPANLPRVDEVRIDATVLAFSLALSIVATLLFGLLPAVNASRLNLSEALKQGGSKGPVSGGARFRSALVVAEIALSVMLLAGAGLLMRSLQVLNQVNLGFTTERVVVGYTQAVPVGPDGRRLRSIFYRDFLERLRGMPGVSAAAGVGVLPLGRESSQRTDYFIQGRPEGQPGERLRGQVRSISSGYFETLQIPLHVGRDFNNMDTPDRPRVAIVNETLARAAFPNESPIGRSIRTATSGWLEIVGVAGDTRWQDPSQPPAPELFSASLQGGGSLTILARTTENVAALSETVRALLREMNPTVPIRIQTMEELLADALAYPRFRTQLIGIFGGMAVVLAAVGIFSVLAYLVGLRTREVAIRRAVGAGAGDVVRLILGNGLRLITIGLVIGLAGALAVARSLEGLLYQVSPWDIASYAGAIAVLGVVALLATLIPALRAATIDPVIALRQE